MPLISVDECRTILGTLADGKTDAEVEDWRDKLTAVANEMYDALQSHLRNRPIDEIRWAAYLNEYPEEAADDRIGSDDDEDAL